MFAAASMTAAPARAADEPLMAAMFVDHAVLQRDRPIEVWGRAQPASKSPSRSRGATRKRAGRCDGRLGRDAAGDAAPAGRTRSTARTATRAADRQRRAGRRRVAVLRPVEHGIHGAQYAQRGVGSRALGQRRHPPRDHSRAPRRARRARISHAPLEWKVAGPTTTAGFFGGLLLLRARAAEDRRTCRRADPSPPGAARASRPGCREQALRQLGGNDAKLDLLGRVRRRPGRGRRRTGARAGRSGGTRSPRLAARSPGHARKATGTWKPAPAELAQWENWGVPELAEYDGMMWYRAHVKLSAAQAKQAAKLSLGVIDDVDLGVGQRPAHRQRLR